MGRIFSVAFEASAVARIDGKSNCIPYAGGVIWPVMPAREPYERVLRDSLEDVFVVATRQGLDTGQLTAEFDADRAPGPHQVHTLTISVRYTSLAVTVDDIPHEWLTTGTGFIDTRFFRRMAALLSDLAKKAEQEGRIL
jgi:hypothetical protein